MHPRASSILGGLLGNKGVVREWQNKAVSRPAPFLFLSEKTLTRFRFVLDEDSHLVPELDGVRIFSRSTHEFLHEVPGEARHVRDHCCGGGRMHS